MNPTAPTTAPAPGPSPGPELLMEQLAHAAACYYRSFAVVAGSQGLTLIQGKLLSLLSRPMPMRALAELLGCDASNVTGLVDRLEARGLLRREPDPADRRVKTVLLTPEGEAAVRRIRAEIITGLPGLAQLAAAERRSLSELLDRAFPHGAGA
ncbi:DNA-binding MarR family transcriptional regulator [Kitasatospora gansuensis]|uniref:DNA-binding MarR family transcriptional regulator n=1 Tax=Kitasatospora gansuensis TaxID=258050 RepID=A0A7W7WFZ6_9ACTN|nr:MarR family transcriptional regulator [Kitasatospora gansuensis]MBB4945105.1 DNA-binding MarR family transcriptional regulator [Kitasatospora gansuensis]